MTGPGRILIVDDEQQNRQLLQNLLTTLGYSPETACDGFGALEKLNTDFDLVLLDVMMPEMDGFEVVRRIREDPQIKDIPVIMVTVLDDRDHRLQAVQSGVNDFIGKPIDKIEVAVRVQSLLNMKQAQDAIKSYQTDLEETVEKRTAALLEVQRRFKTLIETAHDGIFIKDRELRYTDVNKAMARFLDKDPSDILGRTDRDVLGNRLAVQNRKVESRVLDGQTVETQETLPYRSLPITVDCIRFPLRSPSNEVMGVCGIVREMVFFRETAGGASPPADDYPSPVMQNMLGKARIAAETDATVLLTGESGSGKDHLARYIHDLSARRHGPFFSVNCAAIPSELAESELFGHEAGAFTGAMRRKRGLVELAEGGTLLLNEIGELSGILQGKLLTFLDTFSFTRVGGERSVTVSIRLIAATSRDLGAEVSQSRFRKDLYYRLNVFPIDLPPLRERWEDIPLLVKEIMHKLAANMGLPAVPGVAHGVLARLISYSWPGNIRELRNVLERALILSRGGPIGVNHLVLRGSEPGILLTKSVVPNKGRPYEILADMERSFIEDALQRFRGKRDEAAHFLGISRYALARHMRKLGVNGR